MVAIEDFELSRKYVYQILLDIKLSKDPVEQNIRVDMYSILIGNFLKQNIKVVQQLEYIELNLEKSQEFFASNINNPDVISFKKMTQELIGVFEQILSCNKLSKIEKRVLYSNLSILYRGILDLPNADASIALALANNNAPNHRLYYQQSLIKFLQKDFEKAIICLARAIDLSPNNEVYLFIMGVFYIVGNKNIEISRNYFMQAIQLEPTFIECIPEEIRDIILDYDEDDITNINQKDDVLSSTLTENKELENSNGPAPKVKTKGKIAEDTILKIAEDTNILDKLFYNQKLYEKRITKPGNVVSVTQVVSWVLPSGKIINQTNQNIAKVSVVNSSSEHSRLSAYLDEEVVGCDNPELISKWRNLIARGKFAHKHGEQGIKLLSINETKMIKDKLGEGYYAKLKLLGNYGDVRCYGRLIESQENFREKLLIFDKQTNHHLM